MNVARVMKKKGRDVMTVKSETGSKLEKEGLRGGGPGAASAVREQVDASRERLLDAKVGELEEALSASQAAITKTEQAREIDVALLRAGVIDLETARLVIEHELGLSAEGGVGQAVEQVRERKRFLFTPATGGTPSVASAMSPAMRASDSTLVDAAKRASQSGDRGSLLDYLRLKRKG